ncbi:MAG: potassium transporter TrkG [Rubrivivax sp.]
MSVPLAFAYAGGDAALFAYSESLLVTLGVGLLLFFGCRWPDRNRKRRELQPRDGFLLVTLVWSVLPAFGALPLMLHLPELSFTDAYFEAVSGLTATGATVLTGLERLPPSINIWRCFMMLVGGMGILVLAVAILPMLGVGGSQIFKAETPGPMKDEKLTPRIAETARGLWTVYFGIALACLLAYRWAGLDWPDAFMQMCSTMALGGFTAYDASYAAFDAAAVEGVAIAFMFIAGINYALYFMAWRRRSLRGLRHNPEVRAFLIVVLAATYAIAVLLRVEDIYGDFAVALRHAAFQVTSVATTTGFATVDYAQWPAVAPVLMLFLGMFATCAGSTGGGIKMLRALLLLRQAGNELHRIVHPRAVSPVRIGATVVDPRVLQSVLAFMLIYGAVLVVVTLLLLASGLDMVTAFTAALACLNNIGPGLGGVGPAATYQGLGDFPTWVCSITMLLGRLELFAVLVLFTRGFWRK